MDWYFPAGCAERVDTIGLRVSPWMVSFLVMSLYLLGVVVLLPLITGVVLVLVGIS